LRSRSGRRSQQALAAAEEFGTLLLDHLSVQHNPKVASRGDAIGTEPVDIQKLVITEVANAGVGSPASPGVLVLAKRVEEAIETSEALADVCYSFGISPGEIRAMPIEQRRALAGKIGKSTNLRRFADIVGPSNAVALALHAIARTEHRPFAAIPFSSRNEWISFLFRDNFVISRESSGEEKQISFVEGIAGVAIFFFGGGTDYEGPLLEALKLIDAGGADWPEADVVFITDDYCEVSAEFTRRFASEKEQPTFKVFSLIVGARAEDAITLRRFSDRVVSTSELDEAAAAQIFDLV
jgi:hypothetical protein